MDYFLEFHWWYLLVAFFLFTFFGKGKGGIVVKRFTANIEVLDQRFEECRPNATYAIFKEGSPDHIEIEIDNLFLNVGEELEFYINGTLLAIVKVKRNKEAEFDHWSNEGVNFPAIEDSDELTIKYQSSEVLKGTFR